MNWAYTVKNKIAASAALLALCILVLISNYIDRNHTDNVKNAISTLYDDRLIAEEYILKMTAGVYQIREIINDETPAADSRTSIQNILLHIKEENNAYLNTKFTSAEQEKAAALVKVFSELDSFHLNSKEANLASVNKALRLLNELSGIQLTESKQIMDNAEALYISGKTSSNFVFAIIIVILVVLQAFVFSSKRLIPKTGPKFPSLN